MNSGPPKNLAGLTLKPVGEKVGYLWIFQSLPCHHLPTLLVSGEIQKVPSRFSLY